MFNKIDNLKIIGITFIHDYFQVIFDDGAILNINNKYSIEGVSDYRDLIYKTVVSTKFTDEKFIIQLSDDALIQVGITENDYNCPEAMELVLPNDHSIIHRWGD